MGRQGVGLRKEAAPASARSGSVTEDLVARARGTQHVGEAATMGADGVTLPPKILGALYKHPLTDKGLAAFISDWEGTGQSIL